MWQQRSVPRVKPFLGPLRLGTVTPDTVTVCCPAPLGMSVEGSEAERPPQTPVQRHSRAQGSAQGDSPPPRAWRARWVPKGLSTQVRAMEREVTRALSPECEGLSPQRGRLCVKEVVGWAD